MTKAPPVTTNRQTITLAKFIQTSANTRPSVSVPAVRNAVTSAPSKDQVQLKDLLKNNSLNELMKLKPPANIAQPVATAASKSAFSDVSCLPLIRYITVFLRVFWVLKELDMKDVKTLHLYTYSIYTIQEKQKFRKLSIKPWNEVWNFQVVSLTSWDLSFIYGE